MQFYESDAERWMEIDKLRSKVAEHLQVSHGSRVLDVLVGEGDFARAVAESSKQTQVTAGEILASDLREAKRRIERDRLKEHVDLLRMDVTCMAFAADSFDYVVNFSGWEDFTALSGEEFIDKVFSEMVRVLRAKGTLALAFIPALTPKDELSRKDEELQEYLYKSHKRPKYFHEEFFIQMLKRHGVKLEEKKSFETRKSRLNPNDAKKFLKWCCDNYRSFYAPDVVMRPYGEIIRRFGKFIQKYGVRERRSKFILLIGKKTSS